MVSFMHEDDTVSFAQFKGSLGRVGSQRQAQEDLKEKLLHLKWDSSEHSLLCNLGNKEEKGRYCNLKQSHEGRNTAVLEVTRKRKCELGHRDEQWPLSRCAADVTVPGAVSQAAGNASLALGS